jgi:hypothetical protein
MCAALCAEGLFALCLAVSKAACKHGCGGMTAVVGQQQLTDWLTSVLLSLHLSDTEWSVCPLLVWGLRACRTQQHVMLLLRRITVGCVRV